MFIAKIKSGKNTYVRLMESYRNEEGKPSSRTVKNFGRYEDLIKDNPNAFEELKAKYKEDKETKSQLTQDERHREVERILSLKVPDPSGSDDVSESPSLSYGHYVLKRLWEEDLQIDRKISYLKKSKTQFRFDLNAAVSYMCFSRSWSQYPFFMALMIRIISLATRQRSRTARFLQQPRFSQ